MNTALAERQDAPVANIQPASESAMMIQMIQRAAADPSVDVDKMERLMQMHERFVDRSAAAAFNAAMVRAQQRIKPVARRALNTQTNSTYAKLEDVDQEISPIYTNEGFSLSFGTDDSPLAGHVRVICDVMHAEGHTKQYKADLPLDATGIGGKTNKTGVHAHGSTYSYARRYLTLMIFNVAMVKEDDDGNGASKPQAKLITEVQLKRLYQVVDKCSPGVQRKFNEDWPDASQIPASQYDAILQSLEGAALKYQKALKEQQQS